MARKEKEKIRFDFYIIALDYGIPIIIMIPSGN
jgi:hypothetical protein